MHFRTTSRKRSTDGLPAGHPPTHTGRVRLRTTGVLTMTMIMMGIGLTACDQTRPTDRTALLGYVNRSRSASGVRAVTLSPDANVKADSWARHLVDLCGLEHSQITDGLTGTYVWVGENVGFAGTLEGVHNALMNSPGHRANILRAGNDQVGLGVARGRCGPGELTFVVEVFIDRG